MAEAEAEAKLAEIKAVDEVVAKEEETCEEMLNKPMIKEFILIRKMIRRRNMKLKSLVRLDIRYKKAKKLSIKLN